MQKGERRIGAKIILNLDCLEGAKEQGDFFTT